MVKVSAPGKLMLSGEWSVLEKGNPCIVLAVDKRVFAEIEEAEEITVNLDDFGIEAKGELSGVKIKFRGENEKLVFAKHAIETALNFVQGKGLRVKKFRLKTHGEMAQGDAKKEKPKMGFGGSAAATVAIIAAILKLHNVSMETEQARIKLFKLGAIAHYRAQEKTGSGFDVCASVFGGANIYRRFDAEWLEKELKTRPLGEIVDGEWPGLEIKKIKIPEEMEICVGFSGKSASTTELVKRVHELRKNRREKYDKIISGIREITEQLGGALEKNEKEKILALTEANRKLLKELGDESAVELETKEHSLMAQIARSNEGAGKFSGAGGGDSSIAICFSKEAKQKIEENWKLNSFYPIEVGVSKEGIRME